MNIRLTPKWWYWLAAVVPLAAALAGWRAGLPVTFVTVAAQIVHFAVRTGSVRTFSVQVPAAFLGLLALGMWPPFASLHWLLLVGVSLRLLFDYCLLARTLSLAAWNRSEPLSWRLVKQAYFTPPVRGRFLAQPPSPESPLRFPLRRASCPRRLARRRALRRRAIFSFFARSGAETKPEQMVSPEKWLRYHAHLACPHAIRVPSVRDPDGDDDERSRPSRRRKRVRDRASRCRAARSPSDAGGSVTMRAQFALMLGGVVDLRLRDGQTVHVRSVRPSDAEVVQIFVRGLSDAARRLRFFAPIRELTPSMLKRVMEADGRRDRVLIALAGDGSGSQVVALAQYAANDDQRCDLALVIADGWQNLGLGSLLLDMLIEAARAAGFARAEGDVLRGNDAMLGLARDFDFAVTRSPFDTTMLRITRVLHTHWNTTPAAAQPPLLGKEGMV